MLGREVEGLGGGGSCRLNGCPSEIMHVDEGPRGLANIPLASRVTHTGSTFAFRKRWGQIDWRSLGEYKT